MDSTHYRVNKEVSSFLPLGSSQTKSEEETGAVIVLILTVCKRGHMKMQGVMGYSFYKYIVVCKLPLLKVK